MIILHTKNGQVLQISNITDNLKYIKKFIEDHVGSEIVLVCEGCKRSYSLPNNAVAITTTQAIQSMQDSGAIVMSLGASPSVEDMIDSCDGVPLDGRSIVRQQTEDALAEIRRGLSAGEQRAWVCKTCGRKNSYPESMKPSSRSQESYPYPSDGWFRERSRALVAAHGPLVRMTDCNDMMAVKWDVTYTDGTVLRMGHPGIFEKVELDVSFFPGDTGSQGRHWAAVFFKEAGIDVESIDIFDMPGGASIEIRKMDEGLPLDEDAPAPVAPEQEEETKKAQESEAGGSDAATKAGDHEVRSFWKTLGAALAATAAILLMVFMSTNTTLTAWGDNGHGETNVPSGKDFVAIAAGGWHSLALRKDGSLAAWGRNDYGQTKVPAGKDFVAVAAGEDQSLALRRDGSLAAWGNNKYGQTNVPAGKDFVAIAAGVWHNLALRKDGSLAAWGYDGHGRTNVPSGKDFVAIAAGTFHSLALRKDGSLAAWGENNKGQTNVP